MNKTVNINLAGIFFHIDEDAYLKLQRYLEAIKRSFTDSQGRSEIISDIEARIAELFNERVQNDKQVIRIKEVDEVIAIMGEPEDYLVDDEIFEDEPQPKHKRKTAPSKKLFRDTDSSYIGGVSSGLGHYMGIDAVWVRLLWVLITIGSGGTFVIIYMLFWALVPEAKTTSEKIMMTGEPVTISNIEKKIKGGFESVTDTVTDVAKNVTDTVSDAAKNVGESVTDATKNIDFQKQGSRIKSSSRTFFDAIGDIIMFFLKVFAKFIGMLLMFVGAITLIALIIALFSVGVVNVIHIPGLDLVDIVNAGDTPIWLVSLLTLFTIGIPLFFLFYLGLKILINNLKSIGNIAKFTLLGAWLTAVIGIVIIGVRQASEHAFNESVIEKKELAITTNDTLNLKMVGNDFYSYEQYVRYNGFKVANNKNDGKIIVSSNVNIIVKSTKDSIARIIIDKSADGSNYDKAIERAKNINYNYSFANNELQLDSFLTTDPENKYSDQEVSVMVYLPEGTIVNCNKNTSSFLSYYHSIINSKSANHLLKIIENGTECLNCPLEDKDPKVREQALNKLTSQDQIINIAKNDEDIEIRKLALSKITQQHYIADIAKNDTDPGVRKLAVNKLTVQHEIFNIAKKDEDVETRKLALSKTTAQHNIAHVAKNDVDPEVRKLALKKLTAQYEIFYISKKDEDAEIRKLALSKITAQHNIAHVAKNDVDPEVRKLALKKLTAQHEIFYIAKKDEDAEIRKLALSKITAQHNIAYIAKNDKDPEIRKLANSMLIQ